MPHELDVVTCTQALRPILKFFEFWWHIEESLWNKGSPMWVLLKRGVLIVIGIVAAMFLVVLAPLLLMFLVVLSAPIYLYFHLRMKSAMKGTLVRSSQD